MKNPRQQQIVQIRGGLDLVTAGLGKRPGMCIAAKNYEPAVQGARRRDGYERLDGQPKPSAALPLRWLYFDAGTTEPSVNAKVTGVTSGATGYIYEDTDGRSVVVTSGAWGTNDAAGYLHLRNVTGTFQDNESLTFATANGADVAPTYENEESRDAIEQAEIEQARTLIAAITGSGDVLGVAGLDGDIYAWRNNAGGTAADMWKATETGWVQQTFGETLAFTVGNVAAFTEGETITGGTSGATATVKRVVKQSGAWAGTAAGYLVLASVSGTFQAETITGGTSGGTATIAGDSVAITLPAGGKYRSKAHNFYGTTDLRRLYFVNGAGYAHEWDGTVLAPIKTGLDEADDKPTHLGVLSEHLFLGYLGGGLQNSGTGLPLSFEAADGAASYGLGEDITGLLDETKTALIVAGRTKIAYLTGYDSNDFNLQIVSAESGAVADTLALVGDAYFVDDIGIRSMKAAQSFGDWGIGTISRMVETYFRQQRKAGASIVGAIRAKSKDQYRLYWDNKKCLTAYFGFETPEFLPQEIQFTPTCLWAGEDSGGNEVLLAGGSDGKVYQLDAGTSDDGAAMEYFLRTTFMHQGSPRREKRYHSVQVEFETAGSSTDLSCIAEYGYGEDEYTGGISSAFTIYGEGGFYGDVNWDEFFWSAPVEGLATVDLQGLGTNVSLLFAGSSTYDDPHTISAMTLTYSIRRDKR